MPISPIDEERFQNACHKILLEKQGEKNGIGTLQEKTIHAILKYFYEPDARHQEVRIGNYVADIFREKEIIEIQTRNFNTMRKKLGLFLKNYPVTIVYPIAHTKWLYWIDESTGMVSKKRKSPKTGKIYDAFYELYKIKPFLSHPNLHLCLVLIDMEEYRLLNGWSHDRKRGSTRYDRIPIKLVEELCIESPKEYRYMVPDGLPDPFCSKDFARQAKIQLRTAQLALNILTETETVTRVGKKGNTYLYQIPKEA